MASKELKPCPFCGSGAELDYDQNMGYTILCRHEFGCYMAKVQPLYGYPATVIRGQWNRRAEEKNE